MPEQRSLTAIVGVTYEDARVHSAALGDTSRVLVSLSARVSQRGRLLDSVLITPSAAMDARLGRCLDEVLPATYTSKILHP